MRVLSLFSGGGLGDYGLTLAGMEIVGQVEIDDYCQKILKLRWPDVPKWTDVKNVRGKEVLERCGAIDLISGGFPCQPFSVAGAREGSEDKRHLWPEMSRIIREVKPRWVLAENVTGLLSISDGRVFGEVVRDLAESGYVVEWDCIPASAVGAPHQRDRVWIVAYSNVSGSRTPGSRTDYYGSKEIEEREVVPQSEPCGQGEKLADTKSERRGEAGRLRRNESEERTSGGREDVANAGREHEPWNRKKLEADKAKRGGGFIFNKPSRQRYGRAWATEPNVGRVAHGITSRVDRLKLLGNGQVVQVVEWIGKQIMQFNLTPQG